MNMKNINLNFRIKVLCFTFLHYNEIKEIIRITSIKIIIKL